MFEKLFRCWFKVLAQSDELMMFGDLDKFGIGILVGVSIEILFGFGIYGEYKVQG